jgi:hypothetical protein
MIWNIGASAGKVKTILRGTAATLVALNGFSQSQVNFNNRVTRVILTHVYAPSLSDTYFHQTGNGADDTPAGSQNWTGFNAIGVNGIGGQYGGSTTFAQLLGASGYNQAESSLQPGVPTTTFRTGAEAGGVVPNTATFNNIPPNVPTMTLEMVAWDNSSGLYPTWTQAFPAWQAGLIAAGTSGVWNQDNTPLDQPPPNLINSQDPSQHVVSFNLYFIPEPSALALVGLGTGILLFCRSKSLSRRT